MTLTLEATIQADGTLTLSELPFSAGETVEVTIHDKKPQSQPDSRYPLRGLPYRYDNPTEPVAEDDWFANQ